MKDSKIEWTDHTFNPWEGCTKVSPGCLNCYAETRNARFAGGTAPNWGRGAPRRRTSEDYWKQPLKWNAAAARDHNAALQAGALDAYSRPRVFCASLADWLDDEVPVEWLADLLALIHRTPHLDWLLLTKRPQNWRQRVKAAYEAGHYGIGTGGDTIMSAWLDGETPANVWIGTTVEDQTRADERIPLLLSIPARVRFLSCEPLLGPVNLYHHLFDPKGGEYWTNPLPKDALQFGWRDGEPLYRRGIHWAICGGESGHGARPMHPDWARSLRDQCQAAGVAFFFKQWGEWLPDNQRNWTVELGKHEFGILNPDGTRINHRCGYTHPAAGLIRVGKSAAGRLLDGREWNEFPHP